LLATFCVPSLVFSFLDCQRHCHHPHHWGDSKQNNLQANINIIGDVHHVKSMYKVR
jgi:hypothetical protein